MSCKFISELRRLSKLSAEAVQNMDSFDPLKKYLHVVRNTEADFKHLMNAISGIQHKQLVLVCGSAGDGKSHLLSHLKYNDPDGLLSDYIIINDATESNAPRETAIETLAGRIAAFRDDRIFIKTPTFYCTFSFWVLFEYLDDQINYKINWRVNRSFAPGDKSDIYILFLETLAIVIKLFLQEPVFVSMYSNEYGEICDGGLLFEAEEHTGILSECLFVDKVFEMFEVFNLTMGVHGHLIGSISNNPANAPDPSILRCLKTRNTNYVCREEHICYYDDNVECITIDNNVYNCNRLLDGYSFEVLHGNHGKLLIQKFSSKSFINYIDNDEWQKLQKIVTKRKIRNYQLICQSNKLYLLTQNEIWVINGLFHHALVESEREEILQRNNRERALLLANRSYEWRYPVNSGRFEEFVADLLAAVYPDQRIRLMGDSNNADGGRDILIFNPDNTLTICQCKAYQRNVGKHHVIDIRDTLDHYGSSGFFLIVSEGITTHLVDHLCVLKQKYSVDWWTKREIFSLLRQYPCIADSFSDIIKITNTVG